MDIEKAKQILESKSYDEMNAEEMQLVSDYETELNKPRVDALRAEMSVEEICETIHDWWQDYEISDEAEDNLSAYAMEGESHA